MSRWTPCKRREFIRRLRRLGFDGPLSGTRHQFMALSYFDNMNLAPRVRCPTLISVALLDDVCPPSGIFAAYNRLECPNELAIYRYHNHEDIPAHWCRKLHWAEQYLTG